MEIVWTEPARHDQHEIFEDVAEYNVKAAIRTKQPPAKRRVG